MDTLVLQGAQIALPFRIVRCNYTKENGLRFAEVPQVDDEGRPANPAILVNIPVIDGENEIRSLRAALTEGVEKALHEFLRVKADLEEKGGKPLLFREEPED